MNTDRIQQLEKNKKFKRKFYAKEVWKNYAVVPPSGILFIALFGFLYLFNVDRLVSLYTIPFIVLLIVGTIWLKATRKYILNQKLLDDNSFAICLTVPLMQKNGRTIMMFSAGNNRLNKYYLEKEKKEILKRFEDNPNYVDFTSSKNSLQIIPDTDIYVIYPSIIDRILNKSKSLTVNRYVIFNNSKKIKYVTLRGMESFS